MKSQFDFDILDNHRVVQEDHIILNITQKGGLSFTMRSSLRKLYENCISFTIITAVMAVTGCADRSGTSAERDNIFWPEKSSAYRIFNEAISRQSHVSWSTGNHTSTPVPVGSMGPVRLTNMLGGFIGITDISAVMSRAIREGVSVILIIGDGFGMSHLSLQNFAHAVSGKKEINSFEYIMNRGACGIVRTQPHSTLVTDSAAAATALASGVMTKPGSLGTGPRGEALKSVLVEARKRGMKTGIVTDTRVTHATPAAFYARTKNRDDEELIANQLAEYDKIDVILGGGASWFIPGGSVARHHGLLTNIALDGSSKRKDTRDLVRVMHDNGYGIVADREALVSWKGGNKKLLGLFAAGHMNSRIDRDDENTGEPSIVDMARAALRILTAGNEGFFLMIECGRLDYDSHYNDMGAVILAIMEMEKTVDLCLGYQKRLKGETLLVFTGDHETGGPAFSYYTFNKKEPALDSMWESGSSSPTIRDFSVFLRQKRSLKAIFSSANSLEELRSELDRSVPFKVSDEYAERIYQALSREGPPK